MEKGGTQEGEAWAKPKGAPGKNFGGGKNPPYPGKEGKNPRGPFTQRDTANGEILPRKRGGLKKKKGAPPSEGRAPPGETPSYMWGTLGGIPREKRGGVVGGAL